METTKQDAVSAGRSADSDPDEWVVRSTPPAAYLLFRGATLRRLEPEDPTHPNYFHFVFFVDEKLRESVSEWECGKADDFLKFSEAQTTLFQRINTARTALGGMR